MEIDFISGKIVGNVCPKIVVFHKEQKIFEIFNWKKCFLI